MEVQNYIYLIVQFITCSAAIYFWRHYKATVIWIFLPFLLYSFLNEISALVLIKYHYPVRSLFNIYTLVSFGVYLYFFTKLLNLKILKWVFIALFLSIWFYDFFTKDFFKSMFDNAINALSIMILFCSFLYFTKLLKSNQVIHFQVLPEFWFVSGLLIFHIGFFPLNIYLGKGYHFLEIYRIAIAILIFLMNIGYTIGFYVSRRR